MSRTLVNMMRGVLVALAAWCAAGAAHAEGFVPGRPGATESAISVPTGHWQIETELARITHDEEGDEETRALSVAQTAFRYGVARGVDVEAIITPYQRVSVESGGVKETADGFGDLTLRARRTFAGQDGGTSFALIGYVTLPTAQDHLGAEETEAGLIATGAFDLSDSWSLAWTLGAASVSNGGDRDADYSAALTLGYAFNDRWSGYVEAAAERAESDSETPTTFDIGAAYLIAEHTQLDAGIEFGVNDAADDVSVFFGWAHMF